MASLAGGYGVAQTSPDTVDFGQVFSDAFAALRQNWAIYLILALVIIGIPVAASTWEVERLVAQQVLSRSNPIGSFQVGYLRALPLGLFGAAVQASVIIGATATFDDRRASFGDCLMGGLRKWPALFLLNLMRGGAVLVGYVLFIVPGVILSLAWYLAGPIQVLEGGSPLASLRRSAELTRGRRWSLFGLSIGLAVFGFLIGLVAGFVGGFVAGFAKAFGAHLPAEVLAYPLTYVLLYPFSAAVSAAVYRQFNAGPTEALVQVFA